MDFFNANMKVFLIAALSLYLLGWLFYLLKKKTPGHVLFICGWMVNMLIFSLNWIFSGAPPFGSMYHVLVFLGLCFFPLHIILRRRGDSGWTSAYFAFASALPLTGALFFDIDLPWRRMPALQSAWFVPHVTSYMVSYALATIAFSMMSVKFFRILAFHEKELRRYDEDAWQIIRMAFPFMTFGLLSGALWAEDAWGMYWSWDPKEIWALITWGLYLIFLHCRLAKAWRKYSDIAHVLAFAALLTTFILVNLLPRLSSALHSYA
ncbi:MAG TPA: hypothetical protein DCZ94_00740 [Lentisphaeria bacterium]|nr:MAG: hypothetical protein A2X48_12305 [Lentisphaerae bacterium GWF2_49_21]HBC85458.1 hypothetical protein [Lentisphaeria bacterium]